MFCRKNKIYNPERYHYQEYMKSFFRDSIFNDGQINTIYRNFPAPFTKWIKEFDSLFTTNYDRNIEFASKRDVNYLHAAFHIRKDSFKHNSFRNQLSDRPIDKIPLIKGFDHLYSTALLADSGELKEFAMKMPMRINSAMKKLSDGAKNNANILRKINAGKLYEAVEKKIENPELAFNDYYPFDKLEKISGTLTILGLSPFNDTHLWEIISKNKDISKLTYFYFTLEEGEYFASYLSEKNVDLLDTNVFWTSVVSLIK